MSRHAEPALVSAKWKVRSGMSPHNSVMPPTQPIFLRMPHGSDRCPHSGMARGALHDLTVPCLRNGFRPPVISHLVGQGRRKVRLICFDSLHSTTMTVARNRPGVAAHLPPGPHNGFMHNDPTFPTLIPRPLFVRIPRSGERCPFSGLTRSTLLSLVLPNLWLGSCPPVESLSPRQPGAKRGVRLVVWASLEAHIRSHDADRQDASEPILAAG